MEKNPVVYATLASLVDAAQAIPSEALESFRLAFCDALRRKREGMAGISSKNREAMLKWESEARETSKHDAAMRVMLAMNISPDFFNRTVRGGKETFNIYAIPKVFLTARMMLSQSPLWGDSNDANTTRGTILALLAGKGSIPKGVASFLDDYMSKLGKGRGNYRSGGTQSSSSAHALAALGLLLVPSAGQYVIPEGHARATLIRLAGQRVSLDESAFSASA